MIHDKFLLISPCKQRAQVGERKEALLAWLTHNFVLGQLLWLVCFEVRARLC